ncbi:MAG: polysaccharide deacetylase family protein [Planctomycetes bacterium]|nr:polysaccharide deacetylase family protein [Planctomycetota bacterium]
MTHDKPKAVLHVDLDGAAHIYRHHGWNYPLDHDPLFETGIANLLDFLAQNELRATLFVVADQLDHPKSRALLQRAVDAGHEIASHTLTHPELRRLGRDDRRRELVDSKARLEKELGVTVRGFRAPSYQIDRETFALLAEAGYQWDSSVFPNAKFARQLEALSIEPFPHHPLLDTPLLELPLPDSPGPVPFHPSYSILLGQWYFERGLRSHRKTGAPLVMLFHLTDFANPLPADALPRTVLDNWRAKYYTLSNLSAAEKRRRCQRMLDAVRRHYRVATTRELVAEDVRERKLVLGIATTHETSAALYRGHDCLAAISEERLDRVKFSTKYPPKLSIESVVNTAGVDPREITDVVIAGLPPGKLFKRFVANQADDTFEYHALNDYFPHANKLLYRAFAWTRSLGYRGVLGFLEEKYGIRPRLHFAPHHQCHAASAYRTAPFDDALIVTADGVGDYVSVTVASGSGGRMKLLHSIGYPHSFGQFYTACTQVLGFRANRHEGKITGLSGFGKVDPQLYDKVRSTLRGSGKGFKLDKRYYSEGIIRGWSTKALKRGEDLFETLQYRNFKAPLRRLLKGHSREDVACVFQTILEEQLVELVRPFAEQTGLRNLCLAGGVFANVKANAALFRGLGFDQVYIFPNMGDGGLSCGAALELLQAEPRPFDSVYWGPDFTEAQMEAALRAQAPAGVSFRRYDDVERVIAELLAAKKVVARFNGRMEFGPRALCNRTILYAADEPEANNWLNKRLGRTEFMPFAPVAMKEHADELFLGIQGTEHALKFMTIILDCTEFTRQKCPAIVHVDGTARPQLVTADINPSMHRILTHYHELTGVPLLVNTSYNMHEEPIVCTPEDGVRAFLDSKLDFLAMGPFVATLAGTAELPQQGTAHGARSEVEARR